MILPCTTTTTNQDGIYMEEPSVVCLALIVNHQGLKVVLHGIFARCDPLCLLLLHSDANTRLLFSGTVLGNDHLTWIALGLWVQDAESYGGTGVVPE